MKPDREPKPTQIPIILDTTGPPGSPRRVRLDTFAVEQIAKIQAMIVSIPQTPQGFLDFYNQKEIKEGFPHTKEYAKKLGLGDRLTNVLTLHAGSLRAAKNLYERLQAKEVDTVEISTVILLYKEILADIRQVFEDFKTENPD